MPEIILDINEDEVTVSCPWITHPDVEEIMDLIGTAPEIYTTMGQWCG